MTAPALCPLRHHGWMGGVSTIGGRGAGFGLGAIGACPGAGRTSTGGGNAGTACWLTTGGAGAGCAIGGRTGTALARGGAGRRGSRPGIGISGMVDDGNAAVDGGRDGSTGGGSPRSMASSRRVSRSMVRTASHEDSGVTSRVGVN